VCAPLFFSVLNFSTLFDLELGPGLKAVGASERLDADGGAAADANLVAPDLGEKIGHSARDLVNIVVIGLADHEVQAADERLHVVKAAERLAHAGETVEPGDTCGLSPLLEVYRSAEPTGIEDLALPHRDLAREVEHFILDMKRLHFAVGGAPVGGGPVVRYLEAEFLHSRFCSHCFPPSSVDRAYRKRKRPVTRFLKYPLFFRQRSIRQEKATEGI